MKVCFYDDVNDRFVVVRVNSLDQKDPRFHYGEVEFDAADGVVYFDPGLSDADLIAKTEAEFDRIEENLVGVSA